jgi:hypothetical protein
MNAASNMRKLVDWFPHQGLEFSQTAQGAALLIPPSISLNSPSLFHF